MEKAVKFQQFSGNAPCSTWRPMRVSAVLLGVAACLCAPPASAVELSWEAPAGCPDRANVEQRIQKLLAGASEKSKVSAEGVVTATKSGYRLALTTTRDGTRGERILDDKSCEALAESAALIVAMAIDPAIALTIDEPPPPPPPPPATTTEPEPPAPPPPVAPPPKADTPSPAPVAPPVREPLRPRFVVAAGGDVLGYVFPRAALGASLSVGTIIGPFRFDLAGRYSPLSEHSLDAPAGASGSFELLLGQARAAWLWSLGGFELGPAVGFEAGRARGRGHGVSTSLEARTPWLAGSFGALASHRFGRYALSGEVSLIAPLTRPAFIIEGAGTVHTPAAVAIRAGLSAEVRF